MPTYDYKCGECGRVFSLMRRRESRGAPVDCPNCGASTRKRLFTTAGLLGVRTVSEKPQVEPQLGRGVGFYVQGGTNNTFIDCEGSYNGEAGFVFEGGGPHTLINTKARGNPTGIIVRDGAQIKDYNTDIQ
jgi:putative FmdB family regulatory protein